MLPIKYVSPSQNKRSFRVDIVLSRSGQDRKLLGLYQRPREVQCFTFPQDDLTKDYHVSRHQSGQEPETLRGYGEYYHPDHGELGTPKPFPFTLKVWRRQKPPIDRVKGVEQLKLPRFGQQEEVFINPDDLFSDSKPTRSKADHQFRVDLELFAHELLNLRVYLVEAGNKSALEAYLGQLQERPDGYRYGSPTAQPIANAAIRQVEVYTPLIPWLAITLLAGR